MNINNLIDWLEETKTDIKLFFERLEEWDEKDWEEYINDHSNLDNIFRDFGEIDKAYHKEGDV